MNPDTTPRTDDCAAPDDDCGEVVPADFDRQLEREQVIRLNLAESRRLVDALLAPPKAPNKAFVEALTDYRRTVISDVNPERIT